MNSGTSEPASNVMTGTPLRLVPCQVRRRRTKRSREPLNRRSAAHQISYSTEDRLIELWFYVPLEQHLGHTKKTKELRREKKRSDTLLYQMLPKSVALQLKLSKKVRPTSSLIG